LTNGTGIALAPGLVSSGFTSILISFQSTTPLSVLGVAGAATAYPNPITGTTAGQVLRYSNATTLGFGAVNLAATAAVTGTLPLAYGGVGFTTAASSTILQMLNATTVTTVLVLPTLNGGLGFTTAASSTILQMLNATTVTTVLVLPTLNGGLGFTTGATSSIVGFSNSTTATTFPVGQVPGIATATDASTGNIGEYLSTTLQVASAKPLTSNTVTSVISLALSPGDWDVFPVVGVTGHTSTLVTSVAGSLSNSSSTINTTLGEIVSIPGFNLAMFTATTAGVNTPTVALPPVRRSLTATTTVWLTAQMVFATSTASAFGAIRARRAR
jgi:hypothetical protein